MKKIISLIFISFIFLNFPTLAQFIVNSDGIVTCDNVDFYESETLDGITYTKISSKSDLIIHGGTFPAENACVTGITSMEAWFKGKVDFNSDISHWDVSNVTNFHQTFFNASSFNVDIGDWDVSSAQTMASMFDRANSFNRDISGWDVSNVTDMERMFAKTSFNHDIGNWDVSSVRDMKGMFFTNSSFNQDISNWDVSSVIIMEAMFYGAKAFNQPIGSWNVSNVTNMNGMFSSAIMFNQDLSDWNVGKVQGMNGMFRDNNFNSNISTWNTSSVTNMSNMFYENQVFNQPIGSWDVSNVTNMEGMFKGEEVDINDYTQNGSVGSQFNQDISGWDVGNVITMDNMFRDAHQFNQDLSGWDVSSVQNFSGMFFKAFNFTNDISEWDVSKGSDFSYMFVYALDFNQNLSSWNVENATFMDGMFDMAWNYSQNLSSWCVPLITSEPDDFYRDTKMSADDLPNWGSPCRLERVSLLSPNNSEVNTSLTPSLSWNSVENSTEYEIQISDDNFSSIIVNTTTTSTSYTTPNLNYETTYSWRVRALSTDLTGEWSDAWNFTTEDAPIYPVSKVSLSSPTNTQTNVGLSPTLKWDIDDNANSYIIQVSTDGFNTNMINESVSSTFKSLDNLSYSTTYSWRVRASNELGDGEWSDVWSFTTENEPIPQVQKINLVAPQNNSQDTDIDITFIWNKDKNADSYKIQLSSDNFSNLSFETTISDTSINVSDLDYSTEYQWRVIGENDGQFGEWSDIRNITTKDKPIEPVSKIVLSTPSNNDITSVNPTLSWEVDQNASNYKVEISNDNFNNIHQSVDLVQNSLNLSDLSYNKSYYWRVRASNELGDGEWSDVWSFTTESEPIQKPTKVNLLNPANNDANVPPTLVLSWDSLDDATSYIVEVLKNGSQVHSHELSETSYEITLEYDTKYEWRVRGKNTSGFGEWSEKWNFTIREKLVDPTSIVYPKNMAKGVQTTTTFVWKDVETATSYDFELYEKESNNLVYSENTSDTTLIVSGLDYEKEYRYRVRSVNSVSKSDWVFVDFTTVGMTTSNEGNDMPNDFELGQNYPNPFNPTTSINYSLPQSSYVLLEVYDMMGQKISTLVDGVKSSGTHTITFDATDLSSGTYIYRITTNGFSETKKMFLIK